MHIEKPQLNEEARTERHRRVFASSFSASNFFRRLSALFFRRKTSAYAPLYLKKEPVKVKDPMSRLIRHSVILSVALFIVTSILPARMLATGFTAEYFGSDSDVLNQGDGSQNVPYVVNEEGYILKPSPETEEADRTGMNEVVTHVVRPGDTLSGIASLYGVNVSTLVWENNLSSQNASLRIGQELHVPALNGVTHTIADKETIASIAKVYNIDEKIIRNQNKLDGDTITKGEKLFIPGGKPKEQPVKVLARAGTRSGGRRVSVNTFDPKVVISNGDSPREGKDLIFPTDGKITQGFRSGHYALDIGNRSQPDIWASASGTVILAHNGCVERDVMIDRSCGGGYGNYVIIDHGNGLQTLSGHMETVYVSEGEEVSQGQALGKMGNSGRTYGATGIHLHFEVRDNGVKKNPSLFF